MHFGNLNDLKPDQKDIVFAHIYAKIQVSFQTISNFRANLWLKQPQSM